MIERNEIAQNQQPNVSQTPRYIGKNSFLRAILSLYLTLRFPLTIVTIT